MWVTKDEAYSWFPEESSEPFHIYEDGRTLPEMFPNQYKDIPTDLMVELESAWAAFRAVQKKIDAI